MSTVKTFGENSEVVDYYFKSLWNNINFTVYPDRPCKDIFYGAKANFVVLLDRYLPRAFDQQLAERIDMISNYGDYVIVIVQMLKTDENQLINPIIDVTKPNCLILSCGLNLSKKQQLLLTAALINPSSIFSRSPVELQMMVDQNLI